MLVFPCHSCGRRFSLPDEEAGRDVQCPDCGVLVSVPYASDLADLNPDGTLRLAADDPLVVPGATAKVDPDRLEVLRRAFKTNRTDEDTGEEIDNRTLPDRIEIAPKPEPKRHAPAYDPETGELIRAIAVAPWQEVPMAAIASDADRATGAVPVDYLPAGSRAPDGPHRVPAEGVWLELFRPLNVVVMGVVLVLHVCFNASAVVVNMGLLFFAIAPVVLLLVLLGHWGNVVDEIAIEDRDEMPRPLRSVSLYDDVWSPSVAAGLALLPVVLPTWALLRFVGVPDVRTPAGVIVLAAAAGVTVAAAVVAPAVLLTRMTSGSWANLRPDRVLGVAVAGGADYVKVAGLGLVALPAYLFGAFAAVYSIISAMGSYALGDWGFWGSFPFAHAVLLAGIYLMHAFCWRLGLVYRAHHRAFPWVGQERIRAQPKVAPLSPEARRLLLLRKQEAIRGGRPAAQGRGTI